MNIDEMIEVLNAYKRGEKIEYYSTDENNWIKTNTPLFNFAICEYRIAKPEPKKIKLQAWLIAGEIRWLSENSQIVNFASGPIRIPEEDKEITLP